MGKKGSSWLGGGPRGQHPGLCPGSDVQIRVALLEPQHQDAQAPQLTCPGDTRTRLLSFCVI